MMKFNTTKEEDEAADDWMIAHRIKCRMKDTGAIGGRFTFCFTPTGLGTIFVVRCVCGKEKNVTDFNEW